MDEIKGKWQYQSFCSVPAVLDNNQNPPTVTTPEQIAVPWAPVFNMDLVTSAAGEITGTGELVTPRGTIHPKISGMVIAATATTLPGVELTITVDVLGAIYRLRGFHLENSDHIVGVVIGDKNDLGRQPDGTHGAFAMFPVKAVAS